MNDNPPGVVVVSEAMWRGVVYRKVSTPTGLLRHVAIPGWALVQWGRWQVDVHLPGCWLACGLPLEWPNRSQRDSGTRWAAGPLALGVGP